MQDKPRYIQLPGCEDIDEREDDSKDEQISSTESSLGIKSIIGRCNTCGMIGVLELPSSIFYERVQCVCTNCERVTDFVPIKFPISEAFTFPRVAVSESIEVVKTPRAIILED